MADGSRAIEDITTTLDSFGFGSIPPRDRSLSRRAASPNARRPSPSHRSRSPLRPPKNGHDRHSQHYSSTYSDDFQRQSFGETTDCPRLSRSTNAKDEIECHSNRNIPRDDRHGTPKPQASEVDSGLKEFIRGTDEYEAELREKREAKTKIQEDTLTIRDGGYVVKLTLAVHMPDDGDSKFSSTTKNANSAEVDALLKKYTDAVRRLLNLTKEEPKISADHTSSKPQESVMDHSGSQTEMSAKSYASVTKVTTSTTALPTPQETLTNFDRNNRQEERAPEAFRRENNGRERERAEYEQQARTPRHLPPEPSTRPEYLLDRRSEPPKRNPSWPVQTILILGETGVGKSTWINGIANYLAYGSMSDAERYGQISMIPSEFQMAEGRRMVTVRMGEPSKDEVMEAGKSATQNAHVYELCDERNKRYLRLIDTPGIGDVRGTEVDALNFEKIIDCASQEKELNGICILLKPNNSRVNVIFKYCVFELLNHLSKSAASNILFCFSNTRQTFYGPGDTMPVLQQYLDDLRKQGGVKVPFDDYFCFDNESMRYLASLKSGLRIDERERQAYEKSWQKSVEETEELLRCVSSLPPHNIADTVSVNKARKSIQVITRPLAEITKMIKQNIDMIDDKYDEIHRLRGNEADLGDRLFVPRFNTTFEKIDPVMICRKCSRTEDVTTRDGVYTVNKNVCQEPCYHKFPYMSSAISASTKCKVCNCYSYKHEIIKYIARKQTVYDKDPMIARQMAKTQDTKDTVYIFMGKLEETKRDYEKEQQIIQRCCATFDEFLETSSLLGHGESVAEYLKRLIQEEHRKDERYRDRRLIANMEKQLDDYYKQRDLLDKGRRYKKEVDGEATAANVLKLEENLKMLPKCGKMITEAFEASQADYGTAQYRTSYFALGRNSCKKLYESSSSTSEKQNTERL